MIIPSLGVILYWEQLTDKVFSAVEKGEICGSQKYPGISPQGSEQAPLPRGPSLEVVSCMSAAVLGKMEAGLPQAWAEQKGPSAPLHCVDLLYPTPFPSCVGREAAHWKPLRLDIR